MFALEAIDRPAHLAAILDAYHRLPLEGVFAEPASAASVAGLLALAAACAKEAESLADEWSVVRMAGQDVGWWHRTVTRRGDVIETVVEMRVRVGRAGVAVSTIEDMEREFSRKLDVKIIANLYDNREVISQEVLGELRSQFGEACARSVINRSADLNEATKRRTTVWDVNSKGVAANDINSLTEELLFN